VPRKFGGVGAKVTTPCRFATLEHENAGRGVGLATWCVGYADNGNQQENGELTAERQ
jgi:hypothetical protein